MSLSQTILSDWWIKFIEKLLSKSLVVSVLSSYTAIFFTITWENCISHIFALLFVRNYFFGFSFSFSHIKHVIDLEHGYICDSFCDIFHCRPAWTQEIKVQPKESLWTCSLILWWVGGPNVFCKMQFWRTFMHLDRLSIHLHKMTSSTGFERAQIKWR